MSFGGILSMFKYRRMLHNLSITSFWIEPEKAGGSIEFKKCKSPPIPNLPYRSLLDDDIDFISCTHFTWLTANQKFTGIVIHSACRWFFIPHANMTCNTWICWTKHDWTEAGLRLTKTAFQPLVSGRIYLVVHTYRCSGQEFLEVYEISLISACCLIGPIILSAWEILSCRIAAIFSSLFRHCKWPRFTNFKLTGI